jgi:hypothetical protein
MDDPPVGDLDHAGSGIRQHRAVSCDNNCCTSVAVTLEKSQQMTFSLCINFGSRFISEHKLGIAHYGYSQAYTSGFPARELAGKSQTASGNPDLFKEPGDSSVIALSRKEQGKTDILLRGQICQ